MDVVGFLGGTLVSWNPEVADLRDFVTTASILVEGSLKGFYHTIRILNVYAPYHNRWSFWEWIHQSSILQDKSLILAQDLNLTVSPGEVWGGVNSLDLLSYSFLSLFDSANLNDINHSVLTPTWSNGRRGSTGVVKRLDIFLMVDCLRESIGRYRSWDCAIGFLDHKAIVLEIAFDIDLAHYPFRFNPIWLVDDEFCNLVKDIWSNLKVEVGLSQLCRLVKKLFILKIMVRKWEKGRKE